MRTHTHTRSKEQEEKKATSCSPKRSRSYFTAEPLLLSPSFAASLAHPSHSEWEVSQVRAMAEPRVLQLHSGRANTLDE